MIIKDYYGIYHEVNLSPIEEAQFIQSKQWRGGMVDLFNKEKKQNGNFDTNAMGDFFHGQRKC